MWTKSILSLLSSVLFYAALSVSAQKQSAPDQPQLPDGPGKETVQAVCNRCHTLDRIIATGFNRDGWQLMVNQMISNGAPLRPDQIPEVVDYLARNFPEKPMPDAVIIPGSVDAAIKEWAVPTPGSRPHDPMYAPDGSVWYTGNASNLLGRFDPKTGEFKEYHLKTLRSGPHGLVADRDGNIWFTANQAAYVGKLDPKTGNITEYKMPDPDARDPHTPIFDHNGTLWFTLQGADMIGRLIPNTGAVHLAKVPTPKAQPYGMVVDSKGTVYFDEFGTNKIGRIDPVTMEIREYVLPDAAARPRRIAISSDDVIWYSDYASGHLGRLDPTTGRSTEWLSPGGPQSRPYGMTIVDDIVWYSESGTRPNTVVRFDPVAEKFQTWAIPSGGGVVRNMVHTPDGDLWLACSGVNRIAEVQISVPTKSHGKPEGF
jgi:virginiamycin B lyase